MIRISLKTIFFIVVYFSICAQIYVTDNVLVGSAIVFATAIWMCAAMIRAFQLRNRFILGFSVIGSFWLIGCLGFSVETSSPMTLLENARSSTLNVLSGGRKPVEIESYTGLNRSHYHDIHQSSTMVRVPDQNFVPGRRNAILFMVCISSLAVGCVGGTMFQVFCTKREEQTPLR